MNTNVLKKVEAENIKDDIPSFSSGDTVAVHTIIRDGDKQRIQIFKGLVIGIKGAGLSKSFTVRKISFGVGVEKIFPVHSPNIEKIEVTRKGKVRRSKIYYMRDRIGRMAMKVKNADEKPKASKSTNKKDD